MGVVLKVISGPRAGLEFRTHDERAAITIGRSKQNDFHVLDTAMSRVHAVVAYDETGWYVEDQRSRNGVFVNGEKITRHPLSNGDVFRIGPTSEIAFIVDEEAKVFVTGEVAVSFKCAGCREEIPLLEVIRGHDGRPFHVACRNLDHLVNEELGEFKIVEALPRRGEGFLFRAHQPTLSRSVALQVFDMPLTARAGYREALLEEVRRVSRLLHPNILHILDFAEARGNCFVVMEHFPSSPLDDVLEKRRFVRIRGAVQVAQKALAGLSYARAQGHIISWVSPDMVLATDRHDAKLQLFREPVDESAPAVPERAGSYVAPEIVFADGEPNEASALVYSVGALLYHMLAGIPPFEGDSVEDVARRARRQKPPALRRINLKVSPPLAEVVEQAIHRLPAERPQTLDDFNAALTKATSGR